MDFEQVLKALLAEFERQRIRYAAIGGFAAIALGITRTTADLDFLVHRDDLESLDRVLASLGFQRRFKSENVSQYLHKDPVWGAVDFLHAFRNISLAMLDRARSIEVFGGSQTVRVLQPEDVIGLKIQAIVNNPRRQGKDMEDIERLVLRYGSELDWNRLQEFYELFEMGQEGRDLRNRFEHAD